MVLNFLHNLLVQTVILIIFVYVCVEIVWLIVKRFYKIKSEVKHEDNNNSKNS